MDPLTEAPLTLSASHDQAIDVAGDDQLALAPADAGAVPVSAQVIAELADLCGPLDLAYSAKLVRQVLSADECARLIALGDKVGLRDIACGYRTASSRAILRMPGLARELFARMSSCFPRTLVLAPDNSHPRCLGLTGRSGADGVWQLVGMNELFRLCRYEAGGGFAPHFDGQFCASEDVASFFTVMLYLNGELEGGATNFLQSPDEGGALVTAVQPEAGMAIVFPHYLFHEGEVLRAGHKYIFRTDLMYARLPGTRVQRPERIERALTAVRLAAEAEVRGDMTEAARQLRIAAKCDPETVLCPTGAVEIATQLPHA